METIKQKTWRDIVSKLKQEQKQARDEDRLVEFDYMVYICLSCSGIVLKIGAQPMSECPQCGRYSLELQSELMAKIKRRVDAMNQLDQALDHFQKGDVTGAVQKLQSVIKTDPDYNEAHYNLGEIYLQEGKITEGIASTRKALELEETDAMAHVNRGMGYAVQEQIQEALDEFNRAVQLDPTNAMARFNRGLLFLKTMRIEETRQDWQKYLELEPQSGRADMVRDFFQRFNG